ncbi:hypothetical protein ABZT43_49730 [Streptomyces sp. NPDC005349]|jgi:hypothetical protein|uniref:hypothetical protein n=1 Tax=Streptomyces sp. NPDC005349 TaxID=3157037 RepID=UPI00339EA65C
MSRFTSPYGRTWDQNSGVRPRRSAGVRRSVVLRPPRLEVLRQVLVRDTPLVGADHPDLLALELIAQGLEGDDLVVTLVITAVLGLVLPRESSARASILDALSKALK